MTDPRFDRWLAALETRHLADLRFSEVTRALRALSSTYVERRGRLLTRSAFDSAGKRAAYALYYSPLHFLTVDLIVDALDAASRPYTRVLDLGCGGGAAGAAWGSRLGNPPAVAGVDVHPWALAEAAFTYRCFGLDGDVRHGHAARLTLPRSVDGIVAGWVVNELDEATRGALQAKLLRSVSAGTSVLIVEPIATRVSPWWDDWVRAFTPAGARADEWRFAVELPDLLKRLDRAAGMRHDELSARSIHAPRRSTV